jgi:copper chaperone
MYEFDIPDMSCFHCVGTVKKAIETADPKAAAAVDLNNRKAKVETAVAPEAIARAIHDAGYPTTFKSI